MGCVKNNRCKLLVYYSEEFSNSMDTESNSFSDWLTEKVDENNKKNILRTINTMSVLLLKAGVIKKNIKAYESEEEIEDLIVNIKTNCGKVIHSKRIISEYIKVAKLYCDYKCQKKDQVEPINDIENTNQLMIDSVEYSGDQVEAFLLDADINGCGLDEIVHELTGTDRGYNPLRIWLEKQPWVIEYPDQKYIHADNVFELNETADIILEILEKQFRTFSGYTNADTLFDAVCIELKMFLNDNAIKDKEEVFSLARYLFEKIQFKGYHFYFYWERHIFQEPPTFKVSDANVLKHFIKDNGGIVSKEECLDYLGKLKISYSNLNGLLGIGKSGVVLMCDENHYIWSKSLNIGDEFKQKLVSALNLILKEFPYIVPRQLNEAWFGKLPELPRTLSWNLLLLQQIIEHFLPEYRTVPAMEGQPFTTIKAGIVKNNSIIITCSDLVYAMMVIDNDVTLPQRFSTEDFRRYLLSNGIIYGRELNYINQLTKAFSDRRFAWSSDHTSVLILKK